MAYDTYTADYIAPAGARDDRNGDKRTNGLNGDGGDDRCVFDGRLHNRLLVRCRALKKHGSAER